LTSQQLKKPNGKNSNRNSAALSPRSEQEIRQSVKDLKMADYFSQKPSKNSQITVKDEAPMS